MGRLVGLLLLLSACEDEPTAEIAEPRRPADPSDAVSMRLQFPADTRADWIGHFYVAVFAQEEWTYRRGEPGRRPAQVASCDDAPIGLARLAMDRTFAAAALELRREGSVWFLEEQGPAPDATPLVVAAVQGFETPAPGRVEAVEGGFLLVSTAERRAEALGACVRP